MPDEPTRKSYLELTDAASGSHKFYEVTVKGLSVTVRFGRIGTNGQIRADSYPSAAEAQQAAEKKIGEKLHKGYEAAMSAVEVVNLYREMADREDKSKGQDKVFPHVV